MISVVTNKWIVFLVFSKNFILIVLTLKKIRTDTFQILGNPSVKRILSESLALSRIIIALPNIINNVHTTEKLKVCWVKLFKDAEQDKIKKTVLLKSIDPYLFR
jgi:hypothetical protein